MRYLSAVAFLAALAASSARASPPPPPPGYVFDAERILASPGNGDLGRIAALFADDVAAYENGEPVARGKTAWLRLRASAVMHSDGRVIGYSEGGNDLLVVDTYDSVDRTKLPPSAIADPRMATRSILYRFGPDHLIHVVRIFRVESFWITPRP
jgi:hypothetical protein